MPPRSRRIGMRTIGPSQVGGSSPEIGVSVSIASRRWSGSSSVTSSFSPPTRSLSSSEVPSAITSPWSITAIESARRSASSRYWVVSSTVVPDATRSSIVSHSASRLTRVEAGGGLVEEDHRRASHERRRQVEPAPHAARVGLGDPVRGVGEAEPLEQLVGAVLRRLAAEVVEPPDHHEVLAPGQVLVDGRVLAGQADLGAQRRGVLARRRSRPRARCRRRAAAAWSGCGRRWSCRRRWGRGCRARSRPGRRGRFRAAPATSP